MRKERIMPLMAAASVFAGLAVFAGGMAVAGNSNIVVEGDNKAVGSGDLVDKTFNVSSDFDCIINEGFFNIVFTQSADVSGFKVTGRIPENYVDKMKVNVFENTLHISMEKGQYDLRNIKGEAPTIFITNRSLRKVELEGSGNFTIAGDLNAVATGFSFDIDGSGNMKCGRINAGKSEVDLEVSGSGNFDVAGIKAGKLSVEIDGSGNVNGKNVGCDYCEIEINGSGNVNVGGTAGNLDMEVNGSGSIDAGELKADTGKASVSGVGSILCNVSRLRKKVEGIGKVKNLH